MEKRIKKNGRKSNIRILEQTRNRQRGNIDNSMHNPAKKKTQSQTFDASILVDYVNVGNNGEEKRGYMDILFYGHEGYLFAENKRYYENNRILLRFSSHELMLQACNKHNKKYPNLKVEPMKYYRLGQDRVDTMEFKILKVPSAVNNTSIEKAIRRAIPRGSFAIRKRTRGETVFFTLADTDSAHILKQEWSIRIEDNVHQLMPAYFGEDHINTRKRFVGRFKGFPVDESLANVMDIMSKAVNAKHVYREPNCTSNEILAEFASDKDLSFATLRTIYYKTWKINGIRRDGSWQNKVQPKVKQTHNHKDFRKGKEKEKEEIEKIENEQHKLQTSLVAGILQGAESTLDRIERYNRPFRISDKVKAATNINPPTDHKIDANKENEQYKKQQRRSSPATGSNTTPLGNRNGNNVMDTDHDVVRKFSAFAETFC
jgi:hypothetical protein